MIACTSGPWRVVRAGTLGIMIGGLSILGHGASQPHDVSLVAVSAVVAAAVLGAGAITRQRLSARSVVGFAVLFQLVAHFLLTRLSHHPAPVSVHHSHDHTSVVLPLDPTPLTIDGAMLLTHAVAGLLVVALVLRAEAALFGFADAVARTARVVFGGVPTPDIPLPTAALPLFAGATALPRRAAYAHPQRRRGPPA